MVVEFLCGAVQAVGHRAVGRTEQKARPLLVPATAVVPASAPGMVGHSSQVSAAAAMPARCHQLAGSAADERTCHHCTTTKPNATTTRDRKYQARHGDCCRHLVGDGSASGQFGDHSAGNYDPPRQSCLEWLRKYWRRSRPLIIHGEPPQDGRLSTAPGPVHVFPLLRDGGHVTSPEAYRAALIHD